MALFVVSAATGAATGAETGAATGAETGAETGDKIEIDCGRVDPRAPQTWDYTNPVNWGPTGDAPQSRIKLVENVHFSRSIERLRRGRSSRDPFGDIDYTLRRFPNHHRALWAMSRYGRTRQDRAKEIRLSLKIKRWPRIPECYFQRALSFKPDDPVVHMLYGMHLHLVKQLDDAVEFFERAERLGMKTAEFNYNFGLLLIARKEYAKAKQRAKAAYAMGYPLKGLEKKLVKAGHWP